MHDSCDYWRRRVTHSCEIVEMEIALFRKKSYSSGLCCNAMLTGRRSRMMSCIMSAEVAALFLLGLLGLETTEVWGPSFHASADAHNLSYTRRVKSLRFTPMLAIRGHSGSSHAWKKINFPLSQGKGVIRRNLGSTPTCNMHSHQFEHLATSNLHRHHRTTRRRHELSKTER